MALPSRVSGESLGAYYDRLTCHLSYTYEQIAHELTIPERFVYQTHKKYLYRSKQSQLTNSDIPEPTILNDDQPLTVYSSNAMILCDLHVPGHSKTMLENACKVAQLKSTEDLVIIGDVYDFPSLSRFTHNQKEVSANDVIRIAGDVMRAVFKHFKRVYICNGNHDERLSKSIDDSWDLQLLINASFGRHWPNCEIAVTNYDYIYLNDNWIVGHPSNYSGQAGKTPAELADLKQKNIVTGHNHIVGISQSKSGLYVGIDTGAMLDPRAHWYNIRRLNKFAKWNNGFTVIKNGYPTLYTEQFTDWNAL